jgi:hypothetical protein
LQVLKLPVLLIVLERRDRYSVSKLRSKGVNSVIYNYKVLKISVFEHSEILNVDIIGGFDAIVSIDPVLNELSLRIYII